MSARLTVAQKRLRLISEAAWQATVTQLATLAGWRWYHAPDNRPVTSKRGTVYVQNVKSGFPDLVLVKGERLVFAELKKELGKTGDDQIEWLTALLAAGAEAYLWRPSDEPHVRQVLGVKTPAW